MRAGGRTGAAVVLAALALAAVAGCGGDDEDESPEEVFQGFVETLFDCGEENLERRYDLSMPDLGDKIDEGDVGHAPEADQSKEEFIAFALNEERRDGCRPERVPDFEVFAGEPQGDAVELEARLTGGGEVDAYVGSALDTDSGWKVATISEEE